jgi:thioredoxin reductase
MVYDVFIVGGGPAGLSAALTLGRARKRVLLSDSGPRRNAAAEHVHGFVTRDGVISAASSSNRTETSRCETWASRRSAASVGPSMFA